MVMMLGVTSCDKATNTTSGEFGGIFTVYGNSITPELQDTSYVVGDVSALGLKSGDRAWMRIKYNFDNGYGPYYAKWSIKEVYEIIVPGEITSGTDIADGDYESCISSLVNLRTDLCDYGDMWVWNGLQNINVAYESDGSEPEFRMIAPEIKNDTLQLSLVARIKGGEKMYVKLLTYDLETAYPLLDATEKNVISKYDSIYTKIKLQYFDYIEEVAVPAEVIAGKLKNPFRR
jgi:hypothetical protein